MGVTYKPCRKCGKRFVPTSPSRIANYDWICNGCARRDWLNYMKRKFDPHGYEDSKNPTRKRKTRKQRTGKQSVEKANLARPALRQVRKPRTRRSA